MTWAPPPTESEAFPSGSTPIDQMGYWPDGETLELVASMDWPPLHVLGADMPGAVASLGPYFFTVWCSCGWKGDRLEFEPGDIPREVLDEAALAWRFHVRLSRRVIAADRRLRRREGKS